jgi:hypothetical protein
MTAAICFGDQQTDVQLAKPTPEQIEWHDMEIEMFLCLDPCTWQDREYDDHSTPLEKINPAKLDTDQWVRVAESMGAKQIVFVAKHTGGFCWWQTETRDYGVRSTPWRGGKGDVVSDLAESCRKRGIKLGIYRSVGHGAVLLLNNTPDTSGLIPAADARRSAEFGAEIRRRFGRSIADTTGLIPEGDVERGAEFAAEVRRRFGKSLAETSGLGRMIQLDLEKPTWIDHVISMEDIRHGERVRRYVVEGLAGSSWQPLCDGTAISHKKIDRFDPVEVTRVRLRIEEAATTPRIRKLAVYTAGGQPEPPEPPCATPVAHWTCDAIQDGLLMDTSGRKQNGKVHDAKTVDEGCIGGALKLDGRKSFVDLGNLPSFHGDFTIAAWVNPTPPDTAGLRIILSKETCTVAPNQCRFYLTGDRRIGMQLCGATGHGLWPLESQTAVAAQQWSHVAVTRSGDTFTIYHNGKAVGRKKPAGAIRHRNTISVKLGTVFDPRGTRLNVFDGLIDDVRVYNRALTAADISRLAALKEPSDMVESAPAWQWSPENIDTEWSTVEIDITPFCKEATEYRVEFRKTGGRDDLEIRSLVAVFGGRRIEEYVQREGTGNTFHVNVPGLGIPLKLEAIVRGKDGRDTHGRVLVTGSNFTNR